MTSIIIRMAIIICFYIIGAYATTDIVRLLKGSQLAVWNKSCYCPVCNNRIKLVEQIPIVSYVIGRGICRKCKSKIPFSDIWLEVVVFAVLSVVSIVTNFSYIGLFVCIVFYETLKITCCIKYGIRENDFLKNCIFSLLTNMLVFLLIAFLYLFEHII
jgi:leader peptidase (prepilin peptidase)/N-methyltransferase